MTDSKAGYHLKDIPKGEVGELSKIYEEVDEVRDASTQGCDIMILVELSDTIGAIECYLDKYHPTVTLEDLIVMSDITKRAFKNGRR